MIRARINDRIAATRVVLITADGVNHGEMPKFTALNMARDAGLDLVEVSSGRIPICKVMDYGKMLYQKSKADKNKQHAPSVKEIRISYNIGEHDLAIKVKKVREFLADGHKVMFAMQVKGRERYVAGNAAKEKFLAVVRELAPNSKPTDVSNNDKGWGILIHPQ